MEPNQQGETSPYMYSDVHKSIYLNPVNLKPQQLQHKDEICLSVNVGNC